MMRISELRNKDVINLADGKRLGYIRDIEIDLLKGCVESIIIPEEARFFSLFGKNGELTLRWPQIQKVGIDVILVDPSTPSTATPREHAPKPTETPREQESVKLQPEALDGGLDFFAF